MLQVFDGETMSSGRRQREAPAGWSATDGSVSIDSLGAQGRAFVERRRAKADDESAPVAPERGIILP